MEDQSMIDDEALPMEVEVTQAFNKRLPSQRIIDLLTKLEGIDFGTLATTQPFRVIAFRALLRDYPLRDPSSLWMHAYDVEVDVIEMDPTNVVSAMPELFSVDSGA
jgi:hypothetical protein